MQDKSPILFMTTPFDEPYLGNLRLLMKGRKCLQISANPDNYHEIGLYAKSKGIKYIISTNPAVLNKVVDSGQSESLDNWAGSLFERDGLTYLFLNPLRQLYSVPYGRFIVERFLSKILSPSKWALTPEFSWEPATSTTIERWYDLFTKAILTASDIETVSWDEFPDNPLQGTRETIIRSVCYTGLWEDGNIHTIVIPIYDAPENERSFWIGWMRRFNKLDSPKIFQNGLYDAFHEVRYNAPIRNYIFDTQSMFHSWFCELPKDLAFIAAFTIHNVFYWKDMARNSSGYKQLEYNARDGWATMVSFLNMVREFPEYAWRNHVLKFPVWVPALACNLEGIQCNQNTRATLVAQNRHKHEACESRLSKWFGGIFNPRSPQQVAKLISFYGSSDIVSTGEPELRKFGIRHPINQLFASEIIRSRELGKLISTYLKPSDYSVAVNSNKKKKKPLLWKDRLYYGLSPDHTDTGRFSCRESQLWTGTNLQNQPTEEDSVKAMLEAEDGWELFEIDRERNETYGTAYLSGDENLLETIRQDREEGKDFHIVNAMRFFGLKYEEVSKELRDKVSKRVNHGWNYNMGALVLLKTMGEAAVDKAKKLLGLPAYYTRIQTCEHLLASADKAYPTIHRDFYDFIKTKVCLTKKLVSMIIKEDLCWTRVCFGNPDKNKLDLNAVVAHEPQNLAALILNEDFKDIYWNVQVPDFGKNFRMKAQIHDSIFGRNRIGHRHLVLRAANIMISRETEIIDCHGKKRIMKVPCAIKFGKDWGHCEKWNGDLNFIP